MPTPLNPHWKFVYSKYKSARTRQQTARPTRPTVILKAALTPPPVKGSHQGSGNADAAEGAFAGANTDSMMKQNE